MDHKTTIPFGSQTIETLEDILPENGTLKILFIGRTPSLKSVRVGHYFQGSRGSYFWKVLKETGILKVPQDEFPDDSLLANGYGITHISKIPCEYQNFTAAEAFIGYGSLMEKIDRYRPELIVFTYKNALDRILTAIKHKIPTEYGFNPDCDPLFHSAVFVFPMPGTPCTRAQSAIAMNDLLNFLKITPPKG